MFFLTYSPPADYTVTVSGLHHCVVVYIQVVEGLGLCLHLRSPPAALLLHRESRGDQVHVQHQRAVRRPLRQNHQTSTRRQNQDEVPLPGEADGQGHHGLQTGNHTSSLSSYFSSSSRLPPLFPSLLFLLLFLFPLLLLLISSSSSLSSFSFSSSSLFSFFLSSSS